MLRFTIIIRSRVHLNRYSETNSERLYCLHTVFGPCLYPTIKLVIQKRQKDVMKCWQIKLIEEVKSFLILYKAENLMIKPSSTIRHISPQPFFTLIMSIFAAYLASTLWSLIYNYNLQTIPRVIFSSKNFGINWRRPNFSNTSSISDSAMYLLSRFSNDTEKLCY